MLLGAGINIFLGRFILWIPLWHLLLSRHLHTLDNPFFVPVFDFPLDIYIYDDEESQEFLLLGVIAQMQDDSVWPHMEFN